MCKRIIKVLFVALLIVVAYFLVAKGVAIKKEKEVIILSILAFAAIGIPLFLSKQKEIAKEKHFLFFIGFIALLFSVIYCVSFLDYNIGGIVSISRLKEKAEKEVDAKVEKAKKEVDTAVEINKISQLGSRSRWQNAYGGDRRSYEILLSLGKTEDSTISKIFSSEMEAIESVYNIGVMTLWIEQPIAICKYITEQGKSPCSEGFEPPIGYNAKNVFEHLGYPLWTERARAACLLRNLKDSRNTNRDLINKEELYNKLVSLMDEGKENSLFVAVMALNTYKELTGYSPSGVFDFDGAIKDWSDPKRKKEILAINFSE